MQLGPPPPSGSRHHIELGKGASGLDLGGLTGAVGAKLDRGHRGKLGGGFIGELGGEALGSYLGGLDIKLGIESTPWTPWTWT
jgi:hypothetical protein